MFSAGVFVLQLRHFLFRAVEHTAELIGQTKIDTRAGDFRFPIQLRQQAIAQIVRLNADFFEQRLGDAVALIEQRQKEMFVGNFLMVRLRSEVLRCLERLLHLLGELVDPHDSN